MSIIPIPSLKEVLKSHKMYPKTAEKCLHGAAHCRNWQDIRPEEFHAIDDNDSVKITSVLIGGQLIDFEAAMNKSEMSWMTSAPNTDTLVDLGPHLVSFCCLPSSPTLLSPRKILATTLLLPSETKVMLTTTFIYSDISQLLEN